ncbi:MAG TPA: hypothetical protein VGF23_11410 [Gaiellaceae bacterium]|jgi:hypothetical protein
MLKTTEDNVRSLAELRSWYLSSLRPKLARAADGGTVEPGAVAALDRQVRELLDLSRNASRKAAA